MNKLKMLVLTALTATTVGMGALASAPSASAALPIWETVCEEMKGEYLHWTDAANTAERLWGLDHWLTKLYRLRAAHEYNEYRATCL